MTADVLALLQPRKLLLAALALVLVRASASLDVGLLAVDAAPAGNEHQLAARAEHVGGDGRLDARVLEHRVGMEDREEPLDHEVVDPAVVVVHLVDWMPALLLGARRDDRVVVGDLLVVDDPARAAARRARARTCAPCAYSFWPPTSSAIGLISRDHVAGQVARVRARIRQRLVLLVEPLRGAQRAPRGEPEAAVGVALQRGEVVQQRRALLAL